MSFSNLATDRDQLRAALETLVLGVSDSAVSQHLRVLRSLRLVRSRRVGKIVYYCLDDSDVAQLVQVGLAHLGHVEAAERLAGWTARVS